jgi:hypothetical protein
MRPTEDLGRQSQTRSACGIREAEGVLREHRRDDGRIALREVRVNTHRLGHHADALFVRCAQALSMPEGPADAGSKRSEEH